MPIPNVRIAAIPCQTAAPAISFFMDGHTLRMLFHANKNRAGWTGTVNTGTGGQIVWVPTGLAVTVRQVVGLSGGFHSPTLSLPLTHYSLPFTHFPSMPLAKQLDTASWIWYNTAKSASRAWCSRALNN